MPGLKITLGSGDTHELSFSPVSTLTVISPTRVETAIVEKHHAFTDVVDVVYLKDDPEAGPAAPVVGSDVDQGGNTIPPRPDTIGEDVEATAAAEERAAELGVDLATVSGTGEDGRILVADIEAAAKAE